NDGPFPEHYEAVEAPIDNPLHPHVTSNPVSKRFSSDKDVYGKRDEFPIVCTTYRLTEHFHYWTQHQAEGKLNELQPGFFVEIPEGLAREKGIANGLRQLPVVSKYIDTSTCIGCKPCEVACQEWNDLGTLPTRQTGTYQTLPALDAQFWNLIRFHEQELSGGMTWLMRKDQCMHC